MNKSYMVGVVGASGLVGGEVVQLLARESFPVSELRLFASIEDAGERIEFQGDQVLVRPISADFFKELDIIFFATHPLVSRDLAESAAKAGALVIDASRAFRLSKNVPLIVPEVNAEDLKGVKSGRIIACPGPATIGMALALKPIEESAGLKRVTVAAFYGSTNEGRLGFEEHQAQTVAIFNNADFEVAKFPRQTAFNIFPQVGPFVADSTQEELDIEQELKKILSLPRLKVSAFCAQAPVFAGLSIFAWVETKKPLEVADLKEALLKQPGLMVMDAPDQEEYPDVLSCLEAPQVLVGRIRKDPADSGLQFWMALDNLRKGSALNMVQIANEIVKKGLS